MASSAATAAPAEAKTDIWSQILEISSKKDVIRPRNLVVVGDIGCGASTLMAHIQGLDPKESERAAALQYSCSDVFAGDDEDEPFSRINVWQLEGSTDQKDLLRFGLTVDNFDLSAVLICVNFARPWNIVKSLKAWLESVESVIQSLNLEPKRLEEAKNHLVRRFAEYTEPAEEGKRYTHKRTIKNEQTPLPQLPEGVLVKNLGIPIIICCTNSDAAEGLEKDFGYKESHFEFIHQYLRRFCLQYGAGLVYTSVQHGKNCDLLFDYLQHILYDMDFSSRSQLLEREAVFVPIGWDTTDKIQTDFDNQKLTRDPEEPFDKLITLPPALQLQQTQTSSQNLVTSAEEDQVFLQRLFQQIQSDPSLAAPAGSAAGGTDFLDAMKRMGVVGNTASSPSLMAQTQSPIISGGSPVATPAQPAPVLPAAATSAASLNLPTSTSSASLLPPSSGSSASLPLPSATSTQDLLASLSSTIAAAGSPARVGRAASTSVSSNTEHQALHSFFNSLLGGTGAASSSREAAAKELSKLQKP